MFAQGEFDNALSVLSKLQDEYPESSRLWRAFGHVYYKLDQFDDSAKSYQKALEYGDELSLFEDNYVVALMKSGQESIVMEMGRDLVKIKNKSPYIVAAICTICVQDGDIKLFEKLLLSLTEDDLVDGRNPFVIAATAKHFANLTVANNKNSKYK